jgi:hypothetical protein
MDGALCVCVRLYLKAGNVVYHQCRQGINAAN